ncbi:hypothetical protein B1NLA3E_18155 [Bacillus sp. 1NLA3E]|nr:hypothetical protein B1NLA3E_18155 [Bacillus sp. 1NLA3E]
MKDKHPTGQIYDFMEFKKRKPFFHEQMNIKIGYPINETYILVENLVYKEKQILILKQDLDAKTIILVEAKLNGGQLQYISKLSEESIQDVSRMLKNYI